MSAGLLASQLSASKRGRFSFANQSFIASTRMSCTFRSCWIAYMLSCLIASGSSQATAARFPCREGGRYPSTVERGFRCVSTAAAGEISARAGGTADDLEAGPWFSLGRTVIRRPFCDLQVCSVSRAHVCRVAGLPASQQSLFLLHHPAQTRPRFAHQSCNAGTRRADE